MLDCQYKIQRGINRDRGITRLKEKEKEEEIERICTSKDGGEGGKIDQSVKDSFGNNSFRIDKVLCVWFLSC